MLGHPDQRHRSCCRRARPASTSTRSTAPARRTPSRRSSTRPTGCTSRPARPTAVDGLPAKPGFDLPRGAGHDPAGQAQGDHPRPAQRREPRGRPDPLRDDPLPQPRARQPARLGADRPALREGARARHQALPVDDPHRLPAADLPPEPVDSVFNYGRKVFEVGATPTDVPTMPIEFSVAAFRLGHSMVRAAYNWNKIFDDGSGTPRAAVHVLGHRRRPRRRPARCRATGSPTSAASTTSARPGKADLAVPAAQVQPREGDRHAHRRPAARPAAVDVRRHRDPERRPAAESRVPQPHPRAHGAARDRPADGDVHEVQGRQRHAAHEGADPRRQGRRRCSTR